VAQLQLEIASLKRQQSALKTQVEEMSHNLKEGMGEILGLLKKARRQGKVKTAESRTQFCIRHNRNDKKTNTNVALYCLYLYYYLNHGRSLDCKLSPKKRLHERAEQFCLVPTWFPHRPKGAPPTLLGCQEYSH
jgi:hypothetical protein